MHDLPRVYHAVKLILDGAAAGAQDDQEIVLLFATARTALQSFAEEFSPIDIDDSVTDKITGVTTKVIDIDLVLVEDKATPVYLLHSVPLTESHPTMWRNGSEIDPITPEIST